MEKTDTKKMIIEVMLMTTFVGVDNREHDTPWARFETVDGVKKLSQGGFCEINHVRADTAVRLIPNVWVPVPEPGAEAFVQYLLTEKRIAVGAKLEKGNLFRVSRRPSVEMEPDTTQVAMEIEDITHEQHLTRLKTSAKASDMLPPDIAAATVATPPVKGKK